MFNLSTINQPVSNNVADLFDHELLVRLTGWTQARWLTAALLFLVTIYYRPTLGLPYPIIPILVLVMLSLSFNSLMYFLLQREEWLPRLMHAQVAMDLFVITAFIQSTGGVDSPFQWFYLFVIIATGLVAGLKYSMAVAFASILLYGLVLWGQYYFIIPHIPVGNVATYSMAGFHDSSHLLTSVVLHGFMFLGIGGLGGYVAEIAETRKKQLVEADRFYHWTLFRSVNLAGEKERKRISRELHDEIGQFLTALLFNLEKLEDDYFTQPLLVRTRIQGLRQLAKDLLDALHRSIADLRPPMLDDLGLVSSIRWYTDKYIQPLGIEVSLQTHGQLVRLEEAVEVTLYRVFQETLSNVVKHAQARQVQISMQFGANEVTVVIQDDGIGFTTQGSFPGRNGGWGITRHERTRRHDQGQTEDHFPARQRYCRNDHCTVHAFVIVKIRLVGGR